MKRNLRKAFAFILALTMVVSLFACGKKDANPDGGDSSSEIHLQLPTSAR